MIYNEQDELAGGMILFMAVCTGLIVANIYYCQPLVVLISKEFHVSESKAGMTSFFTQAGYALGLLFIVPLGDKLERKNQILITTGLTVMFLIAAALAPSLIMLEIACLLIGATSIVPQLILPLAAHLSGAEKRGKVIGSIMSGLLVGIVLSRTFSGFIGVWLGWRGMFWIAAIISFVLLICMKQFFPKSKPRFSGNYLELMRSLLHLIKEQPLLREASMINALAFCAFGMFWTTMVLHFAGKPFYFDSGKIGMFGLAAATGALAAPLVGGASDKKNPRIAIGYGILLLLTGYTLFGVFSLSVTGMVVGIILIDLGLQGIHVSNQSRVYALMPEARNRLNTVFMTISFIGTSLGSALGLWIWPLFGWMGICCMGILLSFLAFGVYFFTCKPWPKAA